ncbi:MAG: hypothetical protein JO053_12905 [Acidobacteria bacterium]|nr:hypothetical protein [Acidobacteriota bacterium]
MKLLFLSLTLVMAANICSAQKLPRFADYPAKSQRVGTIKVDLSTKDARMFRTNLRNAAKGGINFAGHFVITSWGCGTNCTEWAMIEGRTGKVYFPRELAGAANGLCDLPSNAMPSDAPAETDANYGGVFWKKNSRLVVLTGFKGGDLDKTPNKCGNYFFEWTGKGLRQLRFVAGKPTM